MWEDEIEKEINGENDLLSSVGLQPLCLVWHHPIQPPGNLLSLQYMTEALNAVSSWITLNKFTGFYPVSSSNAVCAGLGVFLVHPSTVS